MEASKLISLIVAAGYGVALIWFLLTLPAEDDVSRRENFESLYYAATGLLIWLSVSIGCIWWGDELGDGLVGAQFGLVSSPSPGWAVKVLGWILLAVPAVVVFIIRIQSR